MREGRLGLGLADGVVRDGKSDPVLRNVKERVVLADEDVADHLPSDSTRASAAPTAFPAIRYERARRRRSASPQAVKARFPATE